MTPERWRSTTSGSPAACGGRLGRDPGGGAAARRQRGGRRARAPPSVPRATSTRGRWPTWRRRARHVQARSASTPPRPGPRPRPCCVASEGRRAAARQRAWSTCATGARVETRLPFGLYDGRASRATSNCAWGARARSTPGFARSRPPGGAAHRGRSRVGPFGNPTSDSARTMVTAAATRVLLRHRSFRSRSAWQVRRAGARLTAVPASTAFVGGREARQFIAVGASTAVGLTHTVTCVPSSSPAAAVSALAAATPKQFLVRRRPHLLQRASMRYCGARQVSDVIVVVPAGVRGERRRVVRPDLSRVRVDAGGARRQDSVAAGFDLVDATPDIVLVHDAARPFATPGRDLAHDLPRPPAWRGDCRAACARHRQARRPSRHGTCARRARCRARDGSPGPDAAGVPTQRARCRRCAGRSRASRRPTRRPRRAGRASTSAGRGRPAQHQGHYGRSDAGRSPLASWRRAGVRGPEAGRRQHRGRRKRGTDAPCAASVSGTTPTGLSKAGR